MIEIQRLTGMRPGEVCLMRPCDIDIMGRIWVFTPASHKLEHHGKDRQVYLRPQAQVLLRRWLRPELTAYHFSPAEATAERKSALRAGRKTPSGNESR